MRYDVGEVAYDRLGQPVGMFPLIPLIASALPAIASVAKSVIPAITKAVPQVANIVSSLAPQGGAPPPPGPPAYVPPPVAPAPIVPIPTPVPSTVVAPKGPTQVVVVRRSRRRRRRPMVVEDGRTGFLHELPMLSPAWWRMRQQQMRAPTYQRPWPVGWVTPALPYTGMQPRRLYMRCSVWPQRAGLVPQFATQVAPGMPGYPGYPGQPGVPGPGMGRRRRRSRRRR